MLRTRSNIREKVKMLLRTYNKEILGAHAPPGDQNSSAFKYFFLILLIFIYQ